MWRKRQAGTGLADRKCQSRSDPGLLRGTSKSEAPLCQPSLKEEVPRGDSGGETILRQVPLLLRGEVWRGRGGKSWEGMDLIIEATACRVWPHPLECGHRGGQTRPQV